MTEGPLSDRDQDIADAVACQRQGWNVRLGHPNTNGWKGTFDEALWISRWGARAEMFCRNWLRSFGFSVDWLEFEYEPKPKPPGLKKWPDLVVGRVRVDVKSIKEADHNLLMQGDDPQRYAYLLVDYSAYPIYRIKGWQWGKKIVASKCWGEPQPGRPCHWYRGELRDPMELVEGMRNGASAGLEGRTPVEGRH